MWRRAGDWRRVDRGVRAIRLTPRSTLRTDVSGPDRLWCDNVLGGAVDVLPPTHSLLVGEFFLEASCFVLKVILLIAPIPPFLKFFSQFNLS